MSIKSRLFILCLLPTVVIVALSVNLANDFKTRLYTYQLVSEKNETIALLAEFSSHLSIVLNQRLNGQSATKSITHAQQTMDAIAKTAHTAEHNHYGISHSTQASSYIEELRSLLQELTALDRNSTIEFGQLIYTVYHDFLAEVHSAESHAASLTVHKLDLVLSDLSWLYFGWNKRLG
ncbi:hypothetical protein [Vibrio sp. M260118]|uniref:hypothetical protein n=1 Tax=Vibrio sp. M260118 TaxID=3020896 RepID=UPI002F408CFB